MHSLGRRLPATHAQVRSSLPDILIEIDLLQSDKYGGDRVRREVGGQPPEVVARPRVHPLASDAPAYIGRNLLSLPRVAGGGAVNLPLAAIYQADNYTGRVVDAILMASPWRPGPALSAQTRANALERPAS